MRYAEKQIVRPQSEDGCDYGHGRRSVLVRNGKKEILHISGQKHWGGVGAERYYSASEIVAYPSDKETCKQKTLAEGRMTRARWAEIAEAMFAHLGTRFPIELIALKHTLLLDEPGELGGPPPRDPDAPKKPPPPRIDSDKIYRVFVNEGGRCQLAECRIIRQSAGKILYTLGGGGERERRTRDIIADGGAGTVEDAVAAYLETYEEQVAEATARLQRAASNYDHANDMLIEARHRVEAMLEEAGGQDR
jgi:hypothetical protein